MSLHETVDNHLKDMTEFINLRIADMKGLERNLTQADSELSSIKEALEGNLKSGATTKEQFVAEIAALNSELAASLENARTIAQNVTGHLDRFAADTKKQLEGVIEGGGKRMKRSRRSNRGRKSVRK